MSAAKKTTSTGLEMPTFSSTFTTALTWWLVGNYITKDPGLAWSNLIRSWWSDGPPPSALEFATLHPSVGAFIDVITKSGQFISFWAGWAIVYFLVKDLFSWGKKELAKLEAKKKADAEARKKEEEEWEAHRRGDRTSHDEEPATHF